MLIINYWQFTIACKYLKFNMSLTVLCLTGGNHHWICFGLCVCSRHHGGWFDNAAGWTKIHGAWHDHQLSWLPLPADETGKHDPWGWEMWEEGGVISWETEWILNAANYKPQCVQITEMALTSTKVAEGLQCMYNQNVTGSVPVGAFFCVS